MRAVSNSWSGGVSTCMWIQRLRLVLWRFRVVADSRQPSAGIRAPPGETGRYCVSLVAIQGWGRVCARRPWRGKMCGGINLGLHEVTCSIGWPAWETRDRTRGRLKPLSPLRQVPAHWCWSHRIHFTRCSLFETHNGRQHGGILCAIVLTAEGASPYGPRQPPNTSSEEALHARA
jgi:hypothetical protein